MNLQTQLRQQGLYITLSKIFKRLGCTSTLRLGWIAGKTHCPMRFQLCQVKAGKPSARTYVESLSRLAPIHAIALSASQISVLAGGGWSKDMGGLLQEDGRDMLVYGKASSHSSSSSAYIAATVSPLYRYQRQQTPFVNARLTPMPLGKRTLPSALTFAGTARTEDMEAMLGSKTRGKSVHMIRRVHAKNPLQVRRSPRHQYGYVYCGKYEVGSGSTEIQRY